KADNVVIICAIENVDPMGVHTGDSITVAPAQTLSDVEYQAMRDMARQVIRAIGVETGGSNIQFGVHPDTGRIVVIEMNPRVSRSSALASKATGFPIAAIAAKLAVGYTLHEITNDITKTTASSFEPAIDDRVGKIPRFNFDKFPRAGAHAAGLVRWEPLGGPDGRSGRGTGRAEGEIATQRAPRNRFPVFKSVAACVAELGANTASLCSRCQDGEEVPPAGGKKVL